MNPNNNNEMIPTLPNEQVFKTPHPVNQITPLSKYLAMTLFVLMPFVGGYVGYKMAGENVVEVAVAPTVIPIPSVSEIEANQQISNSTAVIPNLQVVVLTEFDSAEAMNPQQSEIILTTTAGQESLGVFEGNCNVDPDYSSLLNYRVELQTLITESTQITSRVYCGWNDAGTEIVLYKKSESPLIYEIVQLKLGGSEGQIPVQDVTNVLTVLKTVGE